MSVIRNLYHQSPALLTDLYQITMAYAHWHAADPEREAVFHLFFRQPPFGGKLAIAAGLDSIIEYLQTFRFNRDDLEYLAQLRSPANQPLFSSEFLEYLAELRFCGDLDAVPEGTAVFAHQPMLRIRAPIILGQMLESILLNLVNYPTLIATKAARIAHAVGEGTVLDFGLRKAHGIDGAVTAARAAYLGGVDATSNVLAGKLFGIPVKGTHAHGWVMSFDSEVEAFDKYADALPDNCFFLVDTYDSIQGVENAISAGRQLRERGHEMIGIRLDSGDLSTLAKRARCMLDAAGFTNAKIAASSSLDENKITALREDGAPIVVWGVGTQLATGQPDSALDGVYKLAATRAHDGTWKSHIKLSDTAAKRTRPGVHQVRRFRLEGMPVMDVIYDQADIGADWHTAVSDQGMSAPIPCDAVGDDLLVPVIKQGDLVYAVPSLAESRDLALSQFATFTDAHAYPALVESRLYNESIRVCDELVTQ